MGHKVVIVGQWLFPELLPLASNPVLGKYGAYAFVRLARFQAPFVWTYLIHGKSEIERTKVQISFYLHPSETTA